MASLSLRLPVVLIGANEPDRISRETPELVFLRVEDFLNRLSFTQLLLPE